MSTFDEMLNFDALGAAERITGNSYKDDEQTALLGLALHMSASDAKRTELALRDDTFYGDSAEHALSVFADLGFEVVHSHMFTDTADRYSTQPPAETFYVLFNAADGVLATLETYNTTTLNSSQIYYNWAPNTERVDENGRQTWRSLTSSGHLARTTEKDIWVGYHDARQGLRHTYARLRDGGTFLPTWNESQRLWLLDYVQERAIDRGSDFAARIDYSQQITKSVLDTLPSAVKAAVLADQSLTD